MNNSATPHTVRTEYSENLFKISRPEDIPVKDFQKIMARDTFAGFRGIISREETLAAVDRIKQVFSSKNDHASVGHPNSSVQSNFQKILSGGESRKRRNNDARLFRAMYNPIWAEDIYGMRDIFIRLAQVRNIVAGESLNFAVEKIEPNGLWTAARIHQYPVGGGFFAGHTDYVANAVTDQTDTEFFQLVLVMSEKNKDFSQGGGFVDLGEERVYLEDHFLPGDIVVYDGRTNHGIEDIDPHLPLDLSTFNGRSSALVTLYKVMD